MDTPRKLEPAELYRRCDPAHFKFETTADLPDSDMAIGQERARNAVDFGLNIVRQGYNLYVMGPAGSGKRTLVRNSLEHETRSFSPLLDWVYVNNFSQPHKPLALSLPAGRGRQLRQDMRQLLEELGAAIPAAFESDEYRTRVEQIDAELNERHDAALTELGKEAASHDIALLRTPTGFSLAPMKKGEVISAEDYAKLPEVQQQELERVMTELRSRLERLFRQFRQWQREHRDRVRQLNREVTLFAVGNLIKEIKERYADLEKVTKYLEAVQQDVIDKADDFRRKEESAPGPFGLQMAEPPSFRRYLVNVIVDRGEPGGSSAVFEDFPTYQNLLGRIEHIAQFGMLVTDFSLIKAGALHRANGGYLMLDVHKLLSQPFAWDALKRALSTREIRIESIGQMYSLVSTESLEPEPIPLDLKVVLFGERIWYYLLYAWDPDFRELFKVMADFEEEIPRSAESHDHYARLVATIARQGGMLPFGRDAVSRVIEHAARRASDATRLSTNVREFSDLLGEADFHAQRAGAAHVQGGHVQQAIDGQFARADRARARLNEAILRGTVLIDTDGEKTGQVNGLSVFELGNFVFGEPTRITATTRIGEGNVIDVQREVALGGPIHSKGVLILSAFLAARFSANRLHSVSASLVFEQTYGTVEGDSASVAELAALMSSLAEVPIRQSLAVTGSVNQLGRIQAIGGVNEKIEGFFDICNARGLNGGQGVLIPAANAEHLMLRGDVVQAVTDGKFHVYAVTTIDQAIEILTGIPAGEPDTTGNWPAHSINGRIARRLQQFLAQRLTYAKGGKPKRLRGSRKTS